MGSYCDRCYTLCGSIRDNELKNFDNHDVCSGCSLDLTKLVIKDIGKHVKYNIIKGRTNEYD